MTELKSLKDLGLSGFGRKYELIEIYDEELKAEAVKWVKELERELQKGAIDFVIKFFNLTGEDLKDD